jgi:hypothetical protein
MILAYPLLSLTVVVVFILISQALECRGIRHRAPENSRCASPLPPP